MLSDEQLDRYARHIVLKEIGGDGQQRLLAARIAVIGAGIFARTQYIPRLREIAHLVVLKAIWSRTQVCAHPPTNSRLNQSLGMQHWKSV